jgi:holo-[acyl-carrier protein] synthase
VILGIGTDLVEVDRIRRAHQRHGDRFLQRLFTPAEIADCHPRAGAYQSFAARFAAKEAFLKALGTGLRDGIRWHDMEVVRDGRGRPELHLHGCARELARDQGVSKTFVSLSHTSEHGLATVALEG